MNWRRPARRALLVAGAVMLVGRGTAQAQQPGRTYRLGILSNYTRDAPIWVALFDELAKSGFSEAKNLDVDPRGFAMQPDQAPAVAAELVNSRVDVIICPGKQITAAVQAVTRTVPILSVSDDMVADGLVPSLAHPGGNLTGISILASELDGKRQEILLEIAPEARQIIVLVDPGTAAPLQLEAIRQAAAMRGVELSVVPVVSPEEIAAAIQRASGADASALNVLASPLINRSRQIIIERSAALRIPAIYQWPETAEEGGLAAYGPRFTEIYRQLASLLVKLLRGAKPADLPVEQPTRFELVVNLKTARALGITIPPSILARADEVIE
jgi:putative tryptophan/tyrosine transport system substrate-binding protein